ncbi:MAG: CPBP family intramembrane metalloprotease [Prevotella sp.]|nr:CPBP family intramembrane metalloprotease [Prevotella sp.]
MQTNSYLHRIIDIVLYLVVFFLIQYFVILGVGAVSTWNSGLPMSEFISNAYHGAIDLSGKLMVVVSALSSIITLAVFVYSKWAPVSRVWLASHPWTALAWVVWLALGTILPSEWIIDQLQVSIPSSTAKMFEDIMGEPAGYLAIGILAPIAEELVFRGAILRTLLKMFDRKLHWLPIVISALVFGAVHGNVPQFVHASLMGLLLGWMFYRTDSIAPGVVFHWINNTVAYLMFNLMPQMADGKLIDLFHGDSQSMWMGLGFSLCILIPSLLQLYVRLKRTCE